MTVNRPAADRPNRDRPSVLVVDDEPDITELYVSWLADDYDVLAAMSGREALDRLTPDVDVVLLDRRMPDLTGDEVLATVRDRDVDCRVAMVTAVEPDVDLIAMGFDDYLTKPVTADDIRGVVARLVDLHDQDELLQEYFALASKVATLRASRAADELDGDEEFAALVDRFDRVKRRARGQLGDLMAHDGGDRAFRRLLAGWGDGSDEADVAQP